MLPLVVQPLTKKHTNIRRVRFLDPDLTDAGLHESLSRQESVYSDCLTSPRPEAEEELKVSGLCTCCTTEETEELKTKTSKRAFMRQLALVVQQVHNPDTFFSTQVSMPAPDNMCLCRGTHLTVVW